MFKYGDALTPLCLNALLAAATKRRDSIEKAARWLAAFATPEGAIEEPALGFEFAAYIAALAVSALSEPSLKKKNENSRDAWLKYLRGRQLTEELGWSPEDRAYGGWGYCRVVPRKPRPGDLLTPPLTESNLSATCYALQALKDTGVPATDPAFQRALVFVERQQNWSETPGKFDDGGFSFIYDDAVRNKAGVAGQDQTGRDRYHSYCSMTADGLRCLDLCGKRPSPRYDAALRWLRQRFDGNTHPGRYDERRKNDSQAVYYYYAASLAKSGALDPDMARQLRNTLLQRQKADGSWVNEAGLVREDEPLVANSFALIALSAL